MVQTSMIRIASDEQLHDALTQPSDADVAFAAKLSGDTMILGAGGKMGPTLACRLQRALRAAGRNSRVIAVSRFQSSAAERELKEAGLQTISCDLLDPDSINSLPLIENVLFLAGRKFGSSGDPDLTWAMNAVVPSLVAQHFREARIVVFSTGNVYPFVAAEKRGCTESDPPAPVGEYAQSCLARERIFEYYSKKFKTSCLIFRLNYALDLRYGVLVDIARQVFAGKPVDLSVPVVNVLWQGDANSYAMRSLNLCECPPRILNVTGPETIRVLDAAEFFARRFKRKLRVKGESKGVALLSNAAACYAALGRPSMTAEDLMEAVATWVESGGASLDKATKFQVTDGKF